MPDATGPANLVAMTTMTAHAFDAETAVIGGYHEEDFEIWDSEGRLVAQSRQFALLPA